MNMLSISELLLCQWSLV